MIWIEIVLGIFLGLIVFVILIMTMLYLAWCYEFDNYRRGRYNELYNNSN